MDTNLTQKFPFILDRNLGKANCTGKHVCTSCDTVVLALPINDERPSQYSLLCLFYVYFLFLKIKSLKKKKVFCPPNALTHLFQLKKAVLFQHHTNGLYELCLAHGVHALSDDFQQALSSGLSQQRILHVAH